MLIKIITIALLIVIFAIALSLILKKSKDDEKRIYKIIKIALLIVIITTAIAFIATYKARNNIPDNNQNIRITERDINSNIDYPVRNVEKPKSGDIIVFVKSSCPECKDIRKELLTMIKNEKDTKSVYIVDTNLDEGKKLANTFKVKSVPSAVYIPVNKDKKPLNFRLAREDRKTHQTVFIKENLSRLFELRNEKY